MNRTKPVRKNLEPRSKKNRTDTGGSESKDIHPNPLFPIVGVGASAGGLEAFEQLFANMPPDIGVAFILLPHLDPGHASMMTELLRRVTKLDVNEAVDGTKVKPNCVYVIPPNKEMSITHGTLSLQPLKRVLGVRLPIDSFLRSLADDKGEMAIGIILSGTGTDGTLGIRAIHGAGGTVMVQTPSSAKYSGMPESAVQTGLVDYILPPEKMALQLKDYSEHLGKKAKPLAPREDKLRQILGLIRSRTGHDLSLYKKTTLTRRVEKRMNLHRIDTTAAYADYLRQHPEEITSLFRDMLIGVTQYFRDQEAFDALKKTVLKYLKDLPEDSSFRAWIPACGTGEEAYSITILIMECLDELKRDMKVQIFATDIDADAVNYARNGAYPENIAVDVNAPRLRRYFTKEENGFRVKKEIRELIVFAPQDITKDPPFTKLDLLSCRNLLIYLEAELQNRVVPLFHYSLKPGGLLYLGTSETIGKYADLFEITDKKWKIFRAKKEVLAPVREEAWRVLPWVGSQSKGKTPEELQKTKEIDIGAAAQKMLLETFAPPSVIVNDKGEILYVHGETGKYLQLAPGRPNWNIFDMARKGIHFELRSGVHYALTKMKERRYRRLEVNTDHDRRLVDLTIRPFTPTKETKGLVTILFEDIVEREKKKPDQKVTKRSPPDKDERLEEAEKELAYTRESLQATVEELQASNEELKSTNEEMQSTNEELQSTNEELETSREELQSMNEELTTVNSELQGKIDQLFRTEDDMRILLENTNIGIIFLDNQLSIKRFTSKATKMFNLIPSDVGRPLHDIRSNLEQDDVEKDAKKVLESLQKEQRELQTKEGEWYLMQAVPYRSAENTIDGVVLTFTEITEAKRSAEAIAQLKISAAAGKFAENIVQTVRDPLVVLDGDLRVISANRSFYTAFQTSKEEAEKRLLYELGNGQWDIPELRRLLGEILLRDNEIEDYPIKHDFPGIGPKRMLLNARRISENVVTGGPMILLAIEDMTHREPLREKESASK